MVETSLKGFSNFLILMLDHYYECGDTKRFRGNCDTKSNELHLSSFGYHPPRLVSLAAVFWTSRNAPPKEKIGGALRDIQKTAVRETTLRLDYIGIPYRGLISEK